MLQDEKTVTEEKEPLTEEGVKSEEASSPDASIDEGVKDIAEPSPGNAKEEHEETVPYERFNQVLTKLQELETRVNQKPVSSADEQWRAISDKDLRYIISHPQEYPDHVDRAFQERDQRLKDEVKREVMGSVKGETLQTRYKEAFDPNTPVGREVTRLMQITDQEETLKSLIELAEYRTNGKKTASETRKKIVNNMKTALKKTSGQEIPANTPPPSFMSMPKEEFENYKQNIKLGLI